MASNFRALWLHLRAGLLEGFKSTQQGAATSIYAAFEPSIKGEPLILVSVDVESWWQTRAAPTAGTARSATTARSHTPRIQLWQSNSGSSATSLSGSPSRQFRERAVPARSILPVPTMITQIHHPSMTQVHGRLQPAKDLADGLLPELLLAHLAPCRLLCKHRHTLRAADPVSLRISPETELWSQPDLVSYHGVRQHPPFRRHPACHLGTPSRLRGGSPRSRRRCTFDSGIGCRQHRP
jgi:hypothetical protein